MSKRTALVLVGFAIFLSMALWLPGESHSVVCR